MSTLMVLQMGGAALAAFLWGRWTGLRTGSRAVARMQHILEGERVYAHTADDGGTVKRLVPRSYTHAIGIGDAIAQEGKRS